MHVSARSSNGDSIMVDDHYRTDPRLVLTAQEERAWAIYCEETAGGMDVRNFWYQLSPQVQAIYLEKAST